MEMEMISQAPAAEAFAAYFASTLQEKDVGGSGSSGRSAFQWGASFSALFLLILNQLGRKSTMQATLLILYLITSFPTALFKILRGQFGCWVAFLTVIGNLTFPHIIPGSNSWQDSKSMALLLHHQYFTEFLCYHFEKHKNNHTTSSLLQCSDVTYIRLIHLQFHGFPSLSSSLTGWLLNCVTASLVVCFALSSVFCSLSQRCARWEDVGIASAVYFASDIGLA